MIRRIPALAALLLLASPSLAEDPPAEESEATLSFEYRQKVFGGLGAHMGALSYFVKGKLEPRKDDLIAHSTSLHELSKIVGHLFPEGSGPEAVSETEALAEIWSDPEGFAQRIQTLQAESAALVEAAKGDDFPAFQAQYGKVGKSCGDCHDSYRKDDD